MRRVGKAGLRCFRSVVSRTQFFGTGTPESTGGFSNPLAQSLASNTSGVLPQASSPSERDIAVEALSNDVFGRGNSHLKNVETLASLPEGLFSFPEVCFIGKPNVGKSTVISCLLHNPRLGKGGNKGGTTRLLQFFNVGDALLLVDTPGYGSWRGRHIENGLAVRANAFAILFRYMALRKNGNLKRVYWLMEASARGPMLFQPRDVELFSFLAREQIPFSVLLTKVDRHWWRYREDSRKVDVVGKDGVVRPPRLDAARSVRITTPQEGIQRNIREVFDFLETDKVPILAVSANRLRPSRSINITALQHDIVHYCTQDLPRVCDLNYKQLHELSFAPPLVEEMQRVQLQYPLESFIVPHDDDWTLERMVEQHEQLKARLVRHRHDLGLLSAKDAEECHLVNTAALQEKESLEQLQRDLVGRVSPTVTVLDENASQDKESHSFDGHQSESVTALEFGKTSLGSRTTPSLATPLPPTECLTELHAVSGAITPVSAATCFLTNGGSAVSTRGAATPPLRPLPLPLSLTASEHFVTAINGVAIPRSMFTSVLEATAAKKEDEMAAFAARSGAGAYEELISSDGSAEVSADPFIACPAAAILNDTERDGQSRARTKSTAVRRKERLLDKYVNGVRKPRSVYMQAEGYMCPWLAGAGQQGRSVVKGVAPSASPRGRGGAVLHGLKQHGFGGKSYSVRTVRNAGRATKKTGHWAA